MVISQTQELSKDPKEPSSKPKHGSVFPAKKKLVKRMVFDYLVQSTTPNKAGSSSDAKKSKAILPDPS